MNLSIGIVGLPNVGKSTLFKALTRKEVLIANYPFATIDPNVGIVVVPDPRLQKLTELSQSAKTVPAVVEFVDIAGLVKGAAEGAGLGNQFLSHIRGTDAIAEVVRIFEDADVTHVEQGRLDPIRDIEIVNLELVLADLETVSKRLTKATPAEKPLLQEVAHTLESGKFANRDIPGLQLLTRKPILYVLNKKAGGHNLDEMDDDRWRALTAYLDSLGATYVTVDAAIEGELSEVSADEKQLFRREYGVLDDGVDDLIRAGYRMLGLMTYFTTGEDETRAWTVPIGATAPEAGAAIHSDFKEKFIRAEVVPYMVLVEAGSFARAKELGQVRTEGKDYIVKDGDVIEFKI